MSWKRLLSEFVHRDRLDDELAEEMRLHIEMKEEELRAQGLDPAAARAEARRAFGNQLRFAEQSRRHWLPAWCEELRQDTRFAFRSFAKNKGFVATVLLTMALGIGANSAIFSWIEAVMLRRLPVADPDRLVEVNPKFREPSRWTSEGDDSWSLSYPLFQEIGREQRSFSCLYGRAQGLRSYVDSGDGPWDTRPRAHFVSTCFFETIGIAPMLGRGLQASDVSGGRAQRVAVLSNALWQRRFSSDPHVIGRKMTVGGTVVEIVGVMPPGFVGDTPSEPADFWLPLELFGPVSSWDSWNDRGSVWFDVMGRLSPGVTVQQAQAEMTTLLRNFVRTDLAEWRSSNPNSKATPEMFRVDLASGAGGFNGLRRRYREALGLLFGIVTLLLVLACLNVAGLLMARGVARTREITVRLSLGASRARVIRQLLLESLLLCVAGASLGLVLAHWFSGEFVSMLSRATQPVDLPYRLNAPVLLFTLAVSVLAALVSGFLPAWQSTRSHLSAQLAAAGRAVTQHPSRLLWNRALVCAQVAVGVLLATGAGLLLRSLHSLTTQSIGYDVEHLLVVFLESAPGAEASSRRFEAGRSTGSAEPFRQRLASLPGVRSAALAQMSPMSNWMMSSTIQTPTATTGRVMALRNYVSADYFKTLATPLVAGRLFQPADHSAARRVCVIDEELARTLFPGRSPLGQLVSAGSSRFEPRDALEIVGVVQASSWYGPKQSKLPFRGMLWTTLEQSKHPFLVAMLRTAADPASLAPAVKRLFREERTDVIVTNTATMRQLRDDTLQQERMLAALCTLFGVVALAIIFAGLYGLLAYSVERRVPELGIRAALGASRAHLLSLVARESLALIALGLAAGLPAAIALSRLLRNYLWQVKPTDPLSYLLTLLLVAIVGLLAAARPATRAASVAPAEALRAD